MEKVLTWSDLEKKHPVLLSLRQSKVWPVPEIPEPWYKIVDELFTELKPYITKDTKVTQVKEKYGSLRVHMTNISTDCIEILLKYEEKSKKTCMVCGKKGKSTEVDGIIKVLCKECENEDRVP